MPDLTPKAKKFLKGLTSTQRVAMLSARYALSYKSVMKDEGGGLIVARDLMNLCEEWRKPSPKKISGSILYQLERFLEENQEATMEEVVSFLFAGKKYE